MKIGKTAVGFILIMSLTSCGFPLRYTTVRGTGSLAAEERRVSGFDAVELSGLGNLVIEQGDKESLEITAEENLLPYLESRVIGGTLQLRVREFVSLQPIKEITYRLSVVDLGSIKTSGLGDISISALDTGRLKAEISGSGKITIEDLQADEIDVKISGLGDINLSGQVDTQRVEISGAGNYQARNLESESADVRISGAGNATVWALEKLDVRLSGAGMIEYYGSPVISSEISGMGQLKSAGEK